jgi:acyl-CoA thioesterase-1
MFLLKLFQTFETMIFNKIKVFVCGICVLSLTACGENSPSSQAESAQVQTAESAEKPSSSDKVIIFFGNSLSAGYGVESHESFPALVQARIDSLGYPYKVVNAGVSGETTATGLNRINWVLENQPVHIFVLELGANDGLRGLPPAQTKENLEAMIDIVRKKYPEAKIILAGMLVPPSMGPDYSAAYNRIYPEIAAAQDVTLIPFLLENVGGVDSLNQDDGIHPNPLGNTFVANNVWEVLEPLLVKK